MYRLFLIVILILTQSFRGQSQKTDNSPYSRYGLGDWEDQNFVSSRLMGGLGNSFIDLYHANFLNPASLAFLNATSYEIGLGLKRSNISDGTQSTNQWGGNLNYLSLAFPTRNPLNEALEGSKPYKISGGFNLYKYSSVGYNISSKEFVEDFGVFERNYRGEGGTYRFQMAFAAKYKNFAVGFNFGYHFGNIRFERNIFFQDLNIPFNNKFSDDFSVSSLFMNTGIIYSSVINKSKITKENKILPHRLTIGARIAPSYNLKTTANQRGLAEQNAPNRLVVDTLYLRTNLEGSAIIPLEIGLGINYAIGEKWLFGFDWSSGQWSKYRNDATSELVGTFSNSLFMSIGGFYRPNYRSIDNYWNRVFYRYGFYYHKDPRLVSERRVEDLGVSFGLGMPFVVQRKISHANIGVNFGWKGRNTVIEERYLKINFAFTFNDEEWFIKRKYN